MIKKKPIFLLFICLGIFALGAVTSFLSNTYFTQDYQFTRFADRLFQKEVTSNTLNLHYTLADPDAYGIHNYPLTLGSLSSTISHEDSLLYTELLSELQDFDYEKLSSKNQILYDTLLLLLETEHEELQYPLMYEPLSPTLGIQAQLPVLLAEYTFRNKTDIEDYLALIEDIYPYFQQIIDYENAKSSAGLFMNAETAAGIIHQCQDFISNPENNFLLTTFDERMDDSSFLSEKQKTKYKEKNKKNLEKFCYPAYKMLIDSLQKLQHTGTNKQGLSFFPNGKEYYQHLIKRTTGIYDSIETIEQRLYDQLYEDYMQIQRLCRAFPHISEDAEKCEASFSGFTNPESMLTDLQKQMQYSFPSVENIDYEIKYVNDSLQKHLSPAFYLTPPLDTRSPNSIYLNPNSDLTGMTLYTTLAHEGFPGHLYQTQYFAKTDAHPLLSLLSNGGYVEGWATYIETYAYHYAPTSYEIKQYLLRNRSFQLCLFSILDINIHYHGWNLQQAGRLLSAVGITDEATWKIIYQCLLEDPANYLKYCVGSLYLQDLREDAAHMQANNFDILSFHKKVLEIGPVPFPVLTKYLYLSS